MSLFITCLLAIKTIEQFILNTLLRMLKDNLPNSLSLSLIRLEQFFSVVPFFMISSGYLFLNGGSMRVS